MNRQLKMVFSKHTSPASLSQINYNNNNNNNNKSVQSTPYLRQVLPSQINPNNKSMFNIGNKSCGCG
jgi:hypothetical protein